MNTITESECPRGAVDDRLAHSVAGSDVGTLGKEGDSTEHNFKVPFACGVGWPTSLRRTPGAAPPGGWALALLPPDGPGAPSEGAGTRWFGGEDGSHPGTMLAKFLAGIVKAIRQPVLGS